MLPLLLLRLHHRFVDQVHVKLYRHQILDGVHPGVVVHAKISAVHLKLPLEARVAFAQENQLYGHLHGLCDASYGQVARQVEILVIDSRYLRGDELDLRVVGCVEEIGAAQVVVAPLDARVQACRLDRQRDAGIFQVVAVRKGLLR